MCQGAAAKQKAKVKSAEVMPAVWLARVCRLACIELVSNLNAHASTDAHASTRATGARETEQVRDSSKQARPSTFKRTNTLMRAYAS